MGLRHTIVFCTLFVIAVGLAAFLIHRGSEPHYKGKSLLEWLQIYERDSDEKELARKAVRTIGTNAIPHLITWLKCHTEPKGRWENAIRAAEGFEILGLTAESARPELIRLLNETNRSEAELVEIARSLSYLGKDAFPAIMNLSNRAPYAVVNALCNMRYIGTNAKPAIPFLLQCLRGENFRDTYADPSKFHLFGERDFYIFQTPRVAAFALGNLALESELTVPALANCIESKNVYLQRAAIRALSDLGPQARSAIPALVTLLNSPDGSLRIDVSNTLSRIAPDIYTNRVVPVLWR